jgi:hypothetical protein
LVSKNKKIKIHKTKLLPVVLYGCQKLRFLTSREKHIQEGFFKRALRRIFGPEGEHKE